METQIVPAFGYTGGAVKSAAWYSLDTLYTGGKFAEMSNNSLIDALGERTRKQIQRDADARYMKDERRYGGRVLRACLLAPLAVVAFWAMTWWVNHHG